MARGVFSSALFDGSSYYHSWSDITTKAGSVHSGTRSQDRRDGEGIGVGCVMAENNAIPTEPEVGSDQWFDAYFWQEWDKLNGDAMDEAWEESRWA